MICLWSCMEILKLWDTVLPPTPILILLQLSYHYYCYYYYYYFILFVNIYCDPCI